MKRLLTILMVMVFALSMVACSGGQKTTEPSGQAEGTMAATEAAAATSDSDYPKSPVTAVVPWKVGGGADLIFRAVANEFSKYAGQTMLINNLDGGASVQGVSEYLTQPADGYNLITWGTAQTIKTHMQKTAYEVTDFDALGSFVADSPYILVKADSEFKTLDDLVKYAKENPGKLTIGNSGAGGGNHLAAIQFCLAAGIEANHIAYEGGAASAQATLSGETNCSMNMPAEGLASVEAGELRMLAILSEERSDFFPDVPTAKESGVDVVNEQARGILIQKDAPAEAKAKLEEIFAEIAKDENFQKSVKDLNMHFKYQDAKTYQEYLAKENDMYAELIKSNGLGDRY